MIAKVPFKICRGVSESESASERFKAGEISGGSLVVMGG